MEKIDYNQFRNISVDDLPIKFIKSNSENYPKILAEHGITHLEHLFQAYDNGVFNDGRKTGYKSLKGIVEILKYIYLGEPLVADSYLELKPNGHDSNLFKNDFNNKIRRIGLTTHELFMLGDYYTSKIVDQDEDLDLSLIDIMNSFFNDKDYQNGILSAAIEFVENIYIGTGHKYDSNSPLFKHVDEQTIVMQNLKFKISILLNYYKKKNDNTQIQDEVIESLKNELNLLYSRKRTIDYQIEVLEGQIEALNNSKGISI